jgi:3D-(3,5/4)-trihydroxycyclohexane-1,2-dione acylhydrolase (decyclizing)
MRMTAAHALVEGLVAEGVECVFGILGHGNVQLGQALAEARSRIRYVPVKNEQAAVHAAIAWARQKGTPLAVTTSVGPGATNLVTGAACARINRLPVLLLPGEVFSDGVGPVLQQLETLHGATVNDTLKPVSKYWARLARPEQLRRVLREAFDAMLEPGNEGPATVCLPMDVQAMAGEFDEQWLRAPRDRRSQRVTAGADSLREAADLLLRAERPFLISGGGVIRSGAQNQVRALAEALQMPVAHTQAGKGALAWDHPLNVYGLGPTGSRVANSLARHADVILGVGTRYADFTTASETAFRADARFININLSYSDVGKERGLKLWGDAAATLAALQALAAEHLSQSGPAALLRERREGGYGHALANARRDWLTEVEAWLHRPGTPMRQSAAIGVINEFISPRSVVLSAAGSLPGDLQRLWRDKSDDGLGYLCEYGYSTMGFEIAGGLGARMASPDREVIVLVGDMSFLMSSQELVTAVEQGLGFTAVVFVNHGGQSIRSLQRGHGFEDFGMEMKTREGDFAAVDYVKIAQGMGCKGLRAEDAATLKSALEAARAETHRPTVIQLEVDRDDRIGDTGGWWDVPVPELTGAGGVPQRRREYLEGKAKQVIR